MARLDNRSYYDDFAPWYERERGRGYHQMIDDLELEVVRRYGAGARVLEAGCGTGLLLERVAGFAAHAVGVDLSGQMLSRAQARGLAVAQGSVTALPCADEAFDVTFCFKVLPHIEDIRAAVAELARVTRPGGYILAEFYNPRSLRGLIKRLKPASAVSTQTTDEAVYTRYDDMRAIATYLPASVRWETTRGVRVVTPAAAVFRVPGLGAAFHRVESRLADAPIARRFGGFLIAVLKKT